MLGDEGDRQQTPSCLEALMSLVWISPECRRSLIYFSTFADFVQVLLRTKVVEEYDLPRVILGSGLCLCLYLCVCPIVTSPEAKSMIEEENQTTHDESTKTPVQSPFHAEKNSCSFMDPDARQKGTLKREKICCNCLKLTLF